MIALLHLISGNKGPFKLFKWFLQRQAKQNAARITHQSLLSNGTCNYDVLIRHHVPYQQFCLFI